MTAHQLAQGVRDAAGSLFLGSSGGPVLALGAALLGIALLLFVLMLLSRRQQRRDVREIALAVEAMRAGRTGRNADLDPRSPFAGLAESVNRLGQEITLRLGEAEGAGEGLRALLDAARDVAIVTTDTDGDIRTFSRGASELFGWTEDEALSRPASVLFDDAAWKEFLPKLTRRSLRESGLETRSVLARRDGARFQGEVSVRMFRGRGGEPSGFLVLVRDVDAQARAEDKLRDAEARYRNLVEGLSEGVFVTREGRIVYANPALAALLGRAPGELLETSLRDHVAARDVMAVHAALRETEALPAGTRREMRVVLQGRSQADTCEVVLTMTSVEEAGRPAVLGSALDETARRRVEAELRANESRLDAVLEATSDAVLVVADYPSGGVVRMTNQAFLDLFGLQEGRVLGRAEVEVLGYLRDRGQGAEEIATFLAAPPRGTRRDTVVIGDSPARTLDVTVAPLIDGSGAVLGRILFCRDASQQTAQERRLETQADSLREAKTAAEEAHRRLSAAHSDLERRAHDLERLNTELKALDQMKSNLLANVTHELQTPIVSIRGYTEMILKERLGGINAEQRKGLALSLRNIDRLISMIDNLLAFARMEQEAAALRIEVFPLRAVVEECIATVRARIDAKRISVVTTFADPEVLIHADRDRVVQVVLNVLSNAVKFNREGGEIRVEAGRGQPGFATVRVRDTGIGIPEEDLERIFDRYYQVGGAVEGREGSGLGLSIVRNILRLHGCTIRAESQVGRGATFTFTLPLAQSDLMTSEGELAQPIPRPSAPKPEPAPPGTAEAGPRTPEESGGPPRPRFRIIRRS